MIFERLDFLPDINIITTRITIYNLSLMDYVT